MRLKVRNVGRPPDKEILKYEIIRKKKKKPDYYRHLAYSLDFKQIKELTYLAIKHKNVEAIMGMLKSNVYAATDALNCDEGVKMFAERSEEGTDMAMPELYFFIRRPISEKYKAIFRRLARQAILKTSLRISSRGLKGLRKKTVPYYHLGMPEFNLDETIQHNPLKIHQKSINYKDIYGIKRKRQKRNVVLVLDTSGSMYGRLLLNAALTTSVLAYNMDRENYSIVLFNSTAMVLKNLGKNKKIIDIIDEILDSEAVGFTNIQIGLEEGLKQFGQLKSKKRNQFGVLISDGNFNRGDDPSIVAKKYPTLHVIGMPAENDADRGIDTCKNIAKAGRGKFIAVEDYKEIPRALMNLLSQV